MLTCAGYAILQSFADPMGFPKKLLDKAEIPANYRRVSLHSFMELVHTTFPGFLGANSKYWDQIIRSTILDRDRREQEEGFARQ